MVRRNDISFLIADGHARTSRETFRASAARFIGIGRPTSSAVIKDVVVNLSGRQDFAADYAVSLGATFGAHLVGIAFIYDPVIPDGALGGIPVDVIEIQREETSRTAKAAVERFQASAKAAGISVETRSLDASLGGGATLLGSIARRFDLAVLGQAQREHGASEELLIEAALFESGRPLVVVPYIQKNGLKLDRVLVCWDGGRTAARAIADAMPFLERAKAVDVVVVAEERKQEEITGANMIQHLARHGIRANAKRTAKGDIGIENVILSYAADSGADFLVMGGYGHSRLREFILGGVTRGILASMTLPVLMSH
jgi:nucleotide-binding universal stress UspA family protein